MELNKEYSIALFPLTEKNFLILSTSTSVTFPSKRLSFLVFWSAGLILVDLNKLDRPALVWLVLKTA